MKKSPKKSSHGGYRPGAGRKPSEDATMKRRQFHCDDARWERWKAAAERAGLSMAEWLRAAGDAFCE